MSTPTASTPATAVASSAGPSLTGRLLLWALGALLVVWLSFVVMGYRTGIEEADELTDGHLASVASVLLSLRSVEFVAPGSAAPRMNMPGLKSHDYQQSLSVALWDADGRLIGSSGAADPPAFNTAEGFADLQLGAAQTRWRSFAQWDAAHERKVMVLLNPEQLSHRGRPQPGAGRIRGPPGKPGPCVQRGLACGTFGPTKDRTCRASPMRRYLRALSRSPWPSLPTSSRPRARPPPRAPAR